METNFSALLLAVYISFRLLSLTKMDHHSLGLFSAQPRSRYVSSCVSHFVAPKGASQKPPSAEEKKPLHFHFSFGSRIFHSESIKTFALVHPDSTSGVDFLLHEDTVELLILSPEMWEEN